MSQPAIVPDPSNGKQHVPQDIVIEGVTYKFAPLTIGDSNELLGWVIAQIPDRMAVAKKAAEGLPEIVALQIVQAAIDDVCERPVRLGSPVAQALLLTPAGFVEQLYLGGRKHQPQMTRDDWAELLGKVMQRDEAEMKERLAEKKGGALADPKGPSSTQIPRTSTGSSRTGSAGRSKKRKNSR